MSTVLKTIEEKALAFLKADDKSTAKAIYKTLRDEYKTQVENIEDDIKDTKRKLERQLKIENERLEEAKAQYEEAFLNIDLDIKTGDSRRDYAKNAFRQQISIAKNKVEKIEKTIVNLKESTESEIKSLEKELAFYSEIIEKITNEE